MRFLLLFQGVLALDTLGYYFVLGQALSLPAYELISGPRPRSILQSPQKQNLDQPMNITKIQISAQQKPFLRIRLCQQGAGCPGKC